MSDAREAATRRSYDRIAALYRERFEDELSRKPFDRSFLDNFSQRIPRTGWVVDAGSGPGQIGVRLASAGLQMLSLDLSLEMLRQSQRLVGGASQTQADLRALPLRTGSVSGIVAFFSLIHLPPTDLPGAVTEMRRVLMTGGHVAITTHAAPPPDRVGSSEYLEGGGIHVEEMLGAPVELDFFFYAVDRLASALAQDGFTILQSLEREPYGPEVEAQTRRAYVLARKEAGVGAAPAPPAGLPRPRPAPTAPRNRQG